MDAVITSGPAATPLRLIHARSDAAERAHSPRVLGAEAVSRLATLNAAMRRLREMGIRVVSHSLAGEPVACGDPSVRIVRDPAVSLAALLDAAGSRSFWHHTPGLVTVSCLFAGVCVIWEERR